MTTPRDRSQPQPDTRGKTARKPTLGGETVEPRILMSATWITGTDGDDKLQGTADDDTFVATAGDDKLDGGRGVDTVDYSGAASGIEGSLLSGTVCVGDDKQSLTSIETLIGSDFADTLTGGNSAETLLGGGGDDVVLGSRGDDVLDGGAGIDTLDLSWSTAGITVDLTATGPQDTGALGVDTITGFERVIGTVHADRFTFTSATNGDEFWVDGGSGKDALDLSAYQQADATVAADRVTIDLHGGESFTIHYTNIEGVVFADGRVAVEGDVDGTPTADAGVEQWVTEGDVVTLHGEASSDPNGDTLVYSWTQVSGPTVTLDDPNAAQPHFTAPEGLVNSDLEFVLKVTDGGNTSLATVTVHVGADNDAPTADAGADVVVAEGATVALDGTQSRDPEGGELTYTWVQTAGPAVTLSDASSERPTFTAPDLGANTQLEFELTVSDGTHVSVDTVRVQVGNWTEGTTGDDTLVGTAGADRLRGLGGDDTLVGGDGDDQLNGGAGSDVVDYSTARAAVTVDLTISASQDTGGAGRDQLLNIEGVVGSAFDDVFAFSAPTAGASYTVDGGGGNNTLDLSGFDAADITFAADRLTVDLGSGQSFTIDYQNIATIRLGDVDATVLGGDHGCDNWSGSGIFVDGAETFRLTVGGAGSISWSYDATDDRLSIVDVGGTDGTTTLTIQDLNGDDLALDLVQIDERVGALVSNVDIDLVRLTSGSAAIGSIVLQDGNGTLGNFTAVGDLAGATDIRADVGTISLGNDLLGPLTIHGDVGSMDLQDGNAAILITGDLTTLTLHDLKSPLRVDGDVGTITAHAIDADVTIGGDVETITADSVASTANVTVEQLTGNLDLVIAGSQQGSLFGSLTRFLFSGLTQSGAGTPVDNDPPTADAGVDQTIGEGSVVTLDGSASIDPNGTALTYTWVQTAGPAVTLSDAHAVQPTFTVPNLLANTDLQFELQVTDGVHVSVADEVTVHVNASDDLPTAVAGADVTVEEGDVVTLDGTASSDPEGASLTYQWVQTGGPAVALSDANAAQPTFTAPEGLANTDLQFELRVGDGVHVSVDTVTITVHADDDAPSANAGPNAVVAEGSTVTLAGGAVDPEGQALTYTWVQTGGPAVALSDANAAQPTFTAPDLVANTNLRFELRVSDGVNTSVDTVVVTVNADNDAPTAAAGTAQSVAEGATVTLDGATSSDPEGQGLTYSWVQTAGPAVTLGDATGPHPTFTAPEGVSNSTLQFELRVSDGTTVSSDTVTVTVNADDDAPTAEAGANQLVQPGGTVTLDGTGSSDPEGQTLSYTWVQTGGPAVTLSDANSAQPTFAAGSDAAGRNLRFSLQVSDGTNTSVDTVVVRVAAAPTVQPEPAPAPTGPGTAAPEPAPAANTAPEVVIQNNALPLPGEVVGIRAIAQDADGDNLTYQWTQVAGPFVATVGDDKQWLRFRAPEVTAATDMIFQVTVSDGTTQTVRTVVVTVQPPPAAATDDPGNRPTEAAADGGADEAVAKTDAATTENAGAATAGASTGTISTDPITTVPTNDTSAFATDLAAGSSDDTYDSSSSLLRSATLAGSADSDSSVDSVLTPTTSVDDSTSLAGADADVAGLRAALAAFDAETDADDAFTVRSGLADLVIADAGNQLELTPRLAPTVAAEVASTARWTQVSGTPVALGDVDGAVLRISLPEVFVEEELVFSVEMMQGNEMVVQEVVVQVQPVALQSRSLSIDDYAPGAADGGEPTGEGHQLGLGKIWGAMLAFFGAQSGRRRDR